MHKATTDGFVINLMDAQGIEKEDAIEFLVKLSRAHLKENRNFFKNTNVCNEISINIDENDPQIHWARGMISRMDRDIRKARNGDRRVLSRSVWRKNKRDAQNVIDVFSHCISRNPPETKEEIFEDSKILLYRLRILFNGKSSKNFETIEGNIGVKIQSESDLYFGETETDQYKILQKSPGKMTVRLRDPVPDSVYETLLSAAENNVDAKEIIDWQAFKGPYETKLRKVCKFIDFNEEEFTDLYVETNVFEYDFIKKISEEKTEFYRSNYW